MLDINFKSSFNASYCLLPDHNILKYVIFAISGLQSNIFHHLKWRKVSVHLLSTLCRHCHKWHAWSWRVKATILDLSAIIMMAWAKTLKNMQTGNTQDWDYQQHSRFRPLYFIKKGIFVMFVHTSMAECMSKVETTARLAQLRVDSLGSNSYRRSDPFKIGLWNWYCFFSPSGCRVVIFTV